MGFRAVIPDAGPTQAVAKIDSTIPAADKDSTPLPRVETKNALRMHGSNTIGAALAPDLAEAFLLKKGGKRVERSARTDGHPGMLVSAQLPGGGTPTVIEIEAGGTATAFADLASRTCDVGLASRRATPEEAQRISGGGLGDVTANENEHVLGIDGIAVIVAKENPTDALSLASIAQLFDGETKKWGGDASALGDVALYAREDGSGTNDTFKTLVLGGHPMSPAKRFAENARLAAEVAHTRGAIGFVPMSAVGDAKVIAVGDDDTHPIVPSPFEVATESYPLSRRIYLYTTNAQAHPLAKELVAFALSPDGQRVVQSSGFVDLSVRRRAAAPCTKRCPAKYATLTTGAERLSIDFRFQHGRAELDARAQEDIERLAAFARERGAAKLALFGFADAAGRDDVSLSVSRERAEAVAAALKAKGVTPSNVEGFGEAMPVASNATQSGREHNRRVEAWLLP
jgi:phosphate transport system substrate-binding protein